MKDYMVRASAAGNFIRAFAVTSKGVTEAARAAHNLSPVCSAALGRTMAAGLMMGSMMKGEKDVLTIQFKGDGPIGGRARRMSSRSSSRVTARSAGSL